MKFTFIAAALIGVAAAGAFRSTVEAQPGPAPTKSVWDGVYTDVQARRGAGVYTEQCASCHGTAMEGGEMAPPLTGGGFLAEWSELTLGDLFDRIRLTMPQNDPGALSRQDDADVLAYILSMNKMPAGQTELPKQSDFLKDIEILAQKP
jgi:mono/diheme cytochrome c family protein